MELDQRNNAVLSLVARPRPPDEKLFDVLEKSRKNLPFDGVQGVVCSDEGKRELVTVILFLTARLHTGDQV